MVVVRSDRIARTSDNSCARQWPCFAESLQPEMLSNQTNACPALVMTWPGNRAACDDHFRPMSANNIHFVCLDTCGTFKYTSAEMSYHMVKQSKSYNSLFFTVRLVHVFLHNIFAHTFYSLNTSRHSNR